MKKHTNTIIVFISIAGYVSLFIWNNAFREGVTAGMKICTEELIPSLFPSFFISAFITLLDLPGGVRKILFLPFRLLTGFKDTAAECFLFGFTGGYPVGVITAKMLFEKQKITLPEAQKAALINVNPGIGFSLLVVGKLYTGSVKTGLLLWCSVTAANLLLSVPGRLQHKKNEGMTGLFSEKNRLSAADAFIESTSLAAKNLFSVCLWIVLFTSFTSPLREFAFFKYFIPILEVTNAVKTCISQNRLVLCAFSMGFGGLCIFLQLLSDLRELKIIPYKFIAFRFAVGSLSAVFMFIFIKIFPSVISVSQISETLFVPSSSGVTGCISLMFLCTVFLTSSGSIINYRLR